MEPLPEEENYERLASTPSLSSTHALQRFTELVRRAIASVIAALAPRDRLRLRCYYSQEMTLAQIGKLLGESEATASRSLGRTRRTIRDQVEQRLRAQGMSEAEITDGFAAVTEDAGSLDLAELFGAQPVLEEQRKEGAQDRSK
jgi:hypothetical protein